MNRRIYSSVLSLLVLGFAGCDSAVGPHMSGPVSAAAPTAMYSPQPQPSLDANQTVGRPQLRANTPAAPVSKLPEKLAKNDNKPRPRTTIVVDIDDTVCVTDYNCVLWGIGSDDSRALTNASRTLRELAKKYDILYLTARPAACNHRTERWLTANQFPAGPVMGSRNVIDFVGQTDFKKRTLARLQRERGNLLIGIADRPRDAKAYRANNMLPIIVNPCSGGKFQPNEIMFNDWDGVARFFKANESLLMDPVNLTVNLKRGELRVSIPG